MRPVLRGGCPIAGDYGDYRNAVVDLVSRMGQYCSYCERPVKISIHVEHIQPKDLAHYARLTGAWTNFLLACVNCNSTKSTKNVNLSQIYLPDRDNTFYAFTYSPDGTVEPASYLSRSERSIGISTLKLTGLDKAALNQKDANGRTVAMDRVSQRKEAFNLAMEAKSDLDTTGASAILTDYAIKLAKQTGFFSVWMTVFSDNRNMRLRLIDAFASTRASGCFDPRSARVLSPGRNFDGLVGGGKL